MTLDLNFVSALSFLVDIILAAWSFWSWKKHEHADYFWLFVLWSILIVSRIAQYIFSTFFSSVIYSMPYPEGTLAISVFYTIRGALNWVAIFYILLIMFKWSVSWTQKRGKIIGVLMSIKGILIVAIVSVVANIALSLYLTELWLK